MNVRLRAASTFAVAGLLVMVPPAQGEEKPADNCKGAPVPASLQPPGSPPVLLRAQGEGTQLYACRPAPGGGFAWDLKAPDVALTDAAGKPLGKELAGPVWQANDGSTVAGEVAASAPSPDKKDGPWVLFKATAHTGIGQFARVKYVQRINIQGGLAPTAGCDAAHAGEEQRVAFFAIYMLFQ